jgi:hypothetical protein
MSNGSEVNDSFFSALKMVPTQMDERRGSITSNNGDPNNSFQFPQVAPAPISQPLTHIVMPQPQLHRSTAPLAGKPIMLQAIQTEGHLPFGAVPIAAAPRRDSTSSNARPANQPMASSALNSMKVYVRHLGESTKDDDIRNFSNSFGPLRSIERQRERGGTSHCAYITFMAAADAQQCVQAGNGSMYFANLSAERGESAHLPPLSIRMAESLEERQERLSKRTHHQQAPPPPPPYVPQLTQPQLGFAQFQQQIQYPPQSFVHVPQPSSTQQQNVVYVVVPPQ